MSSHGAERDTRVSRRAVVASLGSLATPRVAYQKSSRKREARMNVVLVLMDDLGWRDLSCYGSAFYETPHIDALARDGMRFTDAYAACPVCSPTRAALLTGRHPARIGLTDYLVGTRRGKLLPADYVKHLPLEEVTIARVLRDAGYVTASIGKWHLGPEPYYPEKHGFHVNIGGCELGHPPSYFWPYGGPGRRVPIPSGADGEYLTDRLTEEAVAFIRQHAKHRFFLYLSHYAVHNPQQSTERWATYFRAKQTAVPDNGLPEFLDWRGRSVRVLQNQPIYAGMIASADEGVGRIVATLREFGLYDNTVIIFTSDNGGLSTAEGSPTSNYPLAGGKGWLYEGGIRVPLIIRWPGLTAPGSTCSAAVTSMDLFPTILGAAGLPPMPELHRDGRDMRALLGGDTSRLHEALYWHYPHYSNQGCNPAGAVRVGRYKLIEDYESGMCELYDIEEDMGETCDLSQRNPDLAGRLRSTLSSWRASVNARMPVRASSGP